MRKLSEDAREMKFAASFAISLGVAVSHGVGWYGYHRAHTATPPVREAQESWFILRQPKDQTLPVLSSKLFRRHLILEGDL